MLNTGAVNYSFSFLPQRPLPKKHLCPLPASQRNRHSHQSVPSRDVNHFLPYSPGCLMSPSHVAVLDEGKGIIEDLLGIVAGHSTKA